MKLPSAEDVKNEGLILGGLTTGFAAPFILLSKLLKKSGVLWAFLTTLLGAGVALFGPEKFQVKNMGRGAFVLGFFSMFTEFSAPKINWGLGRLTPVALNGFSVPDGVRNIL